jgi:thiamine biosynthesis lipoprotein
MTGSARWQVWGTTAELLLAEDEILADARQLVEQELRRIDLACSRFRPDSELSRINRAGGLPVSVSETFREALGVALRAAALTDGAVDPTIGEALKVWGYDRDFQLLSAEDEPRVRVTPARPADWRRVTLDESAQTVGVPPGLSLDLGATAKALAADRAAQAVNSATGCDVLVNLGGDIAVAGETNWRIGVGDDHRGSAAQTVAIRAGGLATSSTTVRRWTRGGAELHHIIDPATGRPATGAWRTVSVAAASCVDANTASTAALVRGAAAVDWLSERDLPARLVRHDGAVVTTGGWPC